MYQKVKLQKSQINEINAYFILSIWLDTIGYSTFLPNTSKGWYKCFCTILINYVQWCIGGYTTYTRILIFGFMRIPLENLSFVGIRQLKMHTLRVFASDKLYIDEYKNPQDPFPELNNYIKTFPCSTVECKCGFSVLNLICTDLRLP